MTSIWTQDIERSKLIAEASNIPNICEDIEQLSNDVDAVILARDDAINHIKYSMLQIMRKHCFCT